MTQIVRLAAAALLGATLVGCDSDGTSSGGGTNADASHCVTRTLRRIYTNECNYDVYVRLIESGSPVFKINKDNARTRSPSRVDFGACRAPAEPVLTRSGTDYICR